MNLLLRRSIFVCSIIALSVALVGCGEELSCSAQETRQLVDRIAQGEAKKAGFAAPDRTISFTLADIITTDKQKAKSVCKAKLTMTISGQGAPEQGLTSEFNITYNVEKTDDGRLYVTVYGL